MKISVSRYFIFVLSFLLASLSIANAQNNDPNPSDIVVKDSDDRIISYSLTEDVGFGKLSIPSNKEMSFELGMDDYQDSRFSDLFDRLYEVNEKGLKAPNIIFEFDDGTIVEFYRYTVEVHHVYEVTFFDFILESPDFYSYNIHDSRNTLFDDEDDKAGAVRYLANCFSTKNIEYISIDDFYIFVEKETASFLAQAIEYACPGLVPSAKTSPAPRVSEKSAVVQQYHDAESFGLKGHVRKCEVVDEQDGSDATDPFCFKELGFVNDGRLSWWNYDGWEVSQSIFKDIVRTPQGSLDCFSYPTTYLSINYRFFYKGGKPYGLSISKFEEDSFLGALYGPELETTIVIWSDTGKDSFCVKKIVIKDRSKEIDKIIEKEFSKGGDILGGILRLIPDKNRFSSFPDENYIIKEKDSHGNPTAFTRKEDGRTIRRTITYWDDKPSSSTTTQVTPKPSATPVSKELSFEDIVTRPFGVLPKDRKKSTMEQILSDLANYDWKIVADNKYHSIELQKAGGYDMTILGEIPHAARANFFGVKGNETELYGFSYSFIFKNHKQASQFAERLLSFLRAEGVELPDTIKYSNEVSAKYGNTLVTVKAPEKGQSYMSLNIDYWGGYWSNGEWKNGWID